MAKEFRSGIQVRGFSHLVGSLDVTSDVDIGGGLRVETLADVGGLEVFGSAEVHASVYVDGDIEISHHSGAVQSILFQSEQAGEHGGITYTEDTGTLQIYAGAGTFRADLNSDGLSVKGGGGQFIDLRFGTSGVGLLAFSDSDSGDAGTILYNPSLNLMAFTVGAEVALWLEESGISLFGGGDLVAKAEMDSGSGQILLYNDGPTQVGRLRATSLGNVTLANDAGGGIYLRPNGQASSTREITWDASSAAPQFRDPTGNLRNMAFVRASGSWSPTLEATGTNPSVSYTLQGGAYMRIFDLVWINAHIIVSSRSGGSGGMRVGNLPFNFRNSNGHRTAFTVVGAGFTHATTISDPYMFGRPVLNDNKMDILLASVSGQDSFAFANITSIGSGDDLWVSGFYWTDDA